MELALVDSAPAAPPRNCVICSQPFAVAPHQWAAIACSAPCRKEWQRRRANSKARNRAHKRRAASSDVTARQEAELRRRARKCPLCAVAMTDKPRMPNSKEIDHILPVNQGGTHTHGNVRIICRTCNLRRPKDGSDYTGMLTLWAHAPDTPVPPRPPRKPRPAPVPRQCQCGASFMASGGTFMCGTCTAAAGHRIAELHASGMSFRQAGLIVGYRSANGEGARYAARRIGYVPVKGAPKGATAKGAPPACPCCGQPRPSAKGRCQPCLEARAWRAVRLRQEEGWTLRMIAGELGYGSITSVTNLMKTVVDIEPRMGRPS